MTHTKVEKASGRKAARYIADQPETCRYCNKPIAVGQQFVRGLTKEPYHPSCRRMLAKFGVGRPVHISRPQADETCYGCGDPFDPDEKFTRVNAQPWHKECYLRERRM